MPQNTIRPKERFIADSQKSDAHQETVLAPAFKAACESALLEYVMNLNTGSNQIDAVRASFQIEGAKGFLRVLLNLGDPTIERAEPNTEGLTPV